MTQIETDEARRTHVLETAERGTCKDTERIRMSKAHLLSGGGRGWDLSEHGKTPSKKRCTHQLETVGKGLIRTRKETDQARCTHSLGTSEGLVRAKQEAGQARCTH